MSTGFNVDAAQAVGQLWTAAFQFIAGENRTYTPPPITAGSGHQTIVDSKLRVIRSAFNASSPMLYSAVEMVARRTPVELSVHKDSDSATCSINYTSRGLDIVVPADTSLSPLLDISKDGRFVGTVPLAKPAQSDFIQSLFQDVFGQMLEYMQRSSAPDTGARALARIGRGRGQPRAVVEGVVLAPEPVRVVSVPLAPAASAIAQASSGRTTGVIDGITIKGEIIPPAITQGKVPSSGKGRYGEPPIQ